MEASEELCVSAYPLEIPVITTRQAPSAWLLPLQAGFHSEHTRNRQEHTLQLRCTNPSLICSLQQSYLDKPGIGQQIHKWPTNMSELNVHCCVTKILWLFITQYLLTATNSIFISLHWISCYVCPSCPNQQNLGIFLPIKRGTVSAALVWHLLLGFLSLRCCLFHADNGRKTAS